MTGSVYFDGVLMGYYYREETNPCCECRPNDKLASNNQYINVVLFDDNTL